MNKFNYYRLKVSMGALLLPLVLLLPSLALAQVQRSFINSGFEQNQPTTTTGCFSQIPQANVTGWLTTHSSSNGSNGCGFNTTNSAGSLTGPLIELWANNFLSVPARSGNVHAELNAKEASTLYQQVCMSNGETLKWSLSHRARNGSETMRFVIGDTLSSITVANIAATAAAGGIVQATTTTAGVGAINSCQSGSNVFDINTCSVTQVGTWADYSGSFRWDGVSGVKYFAFGSLTAGGQGNFLDSIKLDLVPYVEFSSASSSGAESVSDPSTSGLTIKISGVASSSIVVPITVTGGTATLGTDYTTPSGASTWNVTIPAGDYGTGTPISTGIVIVQDSVLESNEKITLSMGAGSGYLVASTATCGGVPISTTTYTIIDDDRPTISINKTRVGANGSVNFGISGTNGVPASVTNIVTTANNTSTTVAALTNLPITTDATDITITETQPTAQWVLTAASCVDNNAGIAALGNTNPAGNLATFTGNAVTIPAANVLHTSDFFCNLTNTGTITLSVVKTVSQSPLVVGQAGQFYTVTVSVANGPTTAAMTVDDALPAGVTTSGAVLVNGAAMATCTIATGSTSLAGCTIPTNTLGPVTITVPITVSNSAVLNATGGNNTAKVTGGGDLLCTGTGSACSGSVVVGIVASDLVPSLSGMPSTIAVGVPYTGSFTCTNSATATAPASAGATCAIAGLPAGLSTVCTPTVPTAGPLAIGAAITCNVTGTPTATTTGAGTLTLTTGAINDANGGTTNGGNNQVTAPINVIGSDMTPSLSGMPSIGTVGVPYIGSFTCTNAAAATAPASIGATCDIAGLPAGLTTVCTPTVPTTATVAVGAAITCNVTGTPTTPGAGTLTLTTGAINDANDGITTGGNNSTSGPINVVASDMVPSLSGMPSTASVGVPYSGSFTCTNAAAATAPASAGATCAIAGLPAGLITVCTPTVPTAGPVAIGAAISCTVTGTPTAPGTGSLSLTTGATNDANGGTTTGGNNSTTGTITTTGSDMVPNLSGMPSTASVGVPYSGSYTCTNSATATAPASAGATCAIAGLPPGLTTVCTPTVPTTGTVAVGTAITCNVTGTPTAPSTGSLTLTTGATNDTSGGTTSGGNNSTTSTIGITGSDMVPSLAGMPNTAQVGIPYSGSYTCTNSATATAPASAGATCAIAGLPPGLTAVCTPSVPTAGTVAVGAVITCNVTGTPTAIGTGSLSLTTGATNDASGGTTTGGNNSTTGSIGITGSDMVPSLAGLPTVAIVGAPYSGNFTCTNSATSTAPASIGATCAIAGLPTGLTVVCAPTVPTLSTLGIGASITCTVSGTPTAVGITPMTLTTGAANDISGGTTPGGNNSVTGSITTRIPAIDVVKAVGVPKQIGPKIFEVSYSIVVANVCASAPTGCAGTATAFNVQVNDNLTTTFPTATSLTISNYAVSSGANGAICTAAASYLGTAGASALFSGANDLTGGQSCVATFKVTVDFGSGALPTNSQNNLAYASAVASNAIVNPGYSYLASGAAVAPINAIATDISTSAPATSGPPGTLPATPLPPTTVGGDSASGLPTSVVFSAQDDGELSIKKSTVTKVTAAGEVVEYSIAVSNSSSNAVKTNVTDTPPLGFTYVAGTAKINGVAISAPTLSNGELIFDIGSIAAKSGAELRYQMLLGDAVEGGEATNCVVARGTSTLTGTEKESGKSCASVVVQTGLFLEKRVSVKTAELGDSVEYSLRVKSVGGTTKNVTISDKLPLGFKIIEGTVKMIRAGVISAMVNPAGAPGPAVTYNVGTVANKEIVEIRYRVRLGVGADLGDGINRAQAKAPFATSSLVATAKVLVTRGVFTREACVAGKVFVDCNQNAMQDKGEMGIPGVRLYMEDGTNMTTDENGQYSICGVRAISHVMQIDTTTMPVGSRMGITSNRNLGDGVSLMMNIKAGEFYRADFVEGSCTPNILEQVNQRIKPGSGAPSSVSSTATSPPKPLAFDSSQQGYSIPFLCTTQPDSIECKKTGGSK